jgi:hypothetical protein
MKIDGFEIKKQKQLNKMEQTVIGLIEEELRLVKKNDILAEAIIKNRGWERDAEKRDYVYSCLRYNMFTMLQFSEMTGIALDTLHNHYLKPKLVKLKMESRLDICYPHRALESLGPKFIFRNEKSEKLLNRKNKKS